MSRSASARKSPWCAGSKSAAPRLTCAADCVMDWKWLGGDGTAQVRFRPGGQVASVDDVSLYSKKDPWSQNTEQPQGPREKFTFECFMPKPQRERFAGSPCIPCSNVNLGEARSNCARSLRRGVSSGTPPVAGSPCTPFRGEAPMFRYRLSVFGV
jgi:hypothetical protein